MVTIMPQVNPNTMKITDSVVLVNVHPHMSAWYYQYQDGG